MKVELLDLKKLVPYARNPRITAHAVDTARVYKPFSQFNGSIKRNGTSLANITGAQFTYSNGLQAVPR